MRTSGNKSVILITPAAHELHVEESKTLVCR